MSKLLFCFFQICSLYFIVQLLLVHWHLTIKYWVVFGQNRNKYLFCWGYQWINIKLHYDKVRNFIKLVLLIYFCLEVCRKHFGIKFFTEVKVASDLELQIYLVCETKGVTFKFRRVENSKDTGHNVNNMYHPAALSY